MDGRAVKSLINAGTNPRLDKNTQNAQNQKPWGIKDGIAAKNNV